MLRTKLGKANALAQKVGTQTSLVNLTRQMTAVFLWKKNGFPFGDRGDKWEPRQARVRVGRK